MMNLINFYLFYCFNLEWAIVLVMVKLYKYSQVKLIFLEENCEGYIIGKSRKEFGMEEAMIRDKGEKDLKELRQPINMGLGW